MTGAILDEDKRVALKNKLLIEIRSRYLRMVLQRFCFSFEDLQWFDLNFPRMRRRSTVNQQKKSRTLKGGTQWPKQEQVQGTKVAAESPPLFV